MGIIELSDGYRTKRSELGLPGTPILRVSDVEGGLIRPRLVDFVRNDLADRFRNKVSRPGDVVLTTKGTVGRTALVGPGDPTCVYSPQVCFFRVLERKFLEPRWLLFWLRSPDFRNQARTVQSQTDMAPYINLRDLNAIEIELAPLPEQKAIARVLGAFEDKIEANERLVSAISEFVQASWEYESAASPVIQFSSIATLDKGVSYKGLGLGRGSPLVNLKNFSVGGLFNAAGTKLYEGEARPHHWVLPGDLVVANTDLTQRREILGQPALVDCPEGSALFSHHVFAVREKDEPSNRLWLFAALRSPQWRERAKSFATGTTVAALPRDALLTFEVPWPSEAVRQSWERGAEVLWKRLIAANHESLRLSELRDALLPPLLSGELRVNDVEGLVGEAE